MEAMSHAAKKELHALVDALRDDQVGKARERLMALQDEDTDPYAHLDDDPFAEMSEEERRALNASIDRGLAEAKAGLGRPIEEFLDEL